MMYKDYTLVGSIIVMSILCCWATTDINEQSPENKKNVSMMINNKDENVKLSDKRYIKKISLNICFVFLFE